MFKICLFRDVCVNQKYVVTGNGAAELTNALMNSFEGIVGITAPTFNEYP